MHISALLVKLFLIPMSVRFFQANTFRVQEILNSQKTVFAQHSEPNSTDIITFHSDSKQSTELISETKQSTELISETKQTTELISQTKQSTELISQTKQPTELLSETKQSTELINETKQSTELISETKQSTELISETKQSTELISETKQSTELISETKQSTELISETKQSTELISETKQSTELIRETKQSTELISETKQSTELISETKQSTELISETKQSTELISETKQSTELISKTKSGHGQQDEYEVGEKYTRSLDKISERTSTWKTANKNSIHVINDGRNINETTGHVNFSTGDCTDHILFMDYFTQMYIIGIFARDSFNSPLDFCQWKVIAPEGFFILATLQVSEPCMGDTYLKSSENEAMDHDSLLSSQTCVDLFHKKNVASLSCCLYFRSGPISKDTTYFPQFHIQIKVTSQSFRLTLPVLLDSPRSGYVTSPGFDEIGSYPKFMNASSRLDVPVNHTVMTSFPRVDFYGGSRCDDGFLELSTVDPLGNAIPEWKRCSDDFIVNSVYNRSLILRFVTNELSAGTGFVMIFTFHPQTHVPPVTKDGLYDCSVSHYPTFTRHLECNLETECLGGEDERECPFSSPACNGSVAFQNKCYSYHVSKHGLTWLKAQEQCQIQGENLVMPKTAEEKEAVERIFQYTKQKNAPAYIGLTRRISNDATIYKQTYKWIDGSVAYNANITVNFFQQSEEELCAFCSPCLPWTIRASVCTTNTTRKFICQREVQSNNPFTGKTIQFPRQKDLTLNENISRQSLLRCAVGHITHDFLSCSPESFCGETRYLTWCPISNSKFIQGHVGQNLTVNEGILRIPTFVCDDRKKTIPFTLVCDFRFHCVDKSDETFCTHESCSEGVCRNGQCISYAKRCDGRRDCLDGSDETSCSHFSKTILTMYPPAIINFDHDGRFSQIKVQRSDPCPMTHFRCHGELSYCLPVFVRCNGVYDCPDHEDEMGCEVYVCPGFFRCFNSRICVHVDNVCDGFPHCPNHHDELLCEFRCPDGCQCQGLAFICRQRIAVKTFSELRFLDGGSSDMSLEDVTSNIYLVRLSFRHCNIKHVTQLSNPNLMDIDLSNNFITSINMNAFLDLKMLKKLTLTGNPLVSLASDIQDSGHYFLESVDLSHTDLRIFNSSNFKNFPFISFLNISYSRVEVIDTTGFLYLPRLKIFDSRGTPLSVFPENLFRGLKRLEIVFAGNYRLCCKENQPEHFTKGLCFSDLDVFSSCDDLLHFDLHRFLVWLMALMSLVGNAVCLITILCIRKIPLKLNFTHFVFNLNVADFLMGTYLSLIIGADHVYRDSYFLSEKYWKDSSICKFSGFLSLLSTVVSVFIIFLATFDRVIVLRCRVKSFHLRRRSPVFACFVAWCAGILLAAIPLLPLTSHWTFYGQTAICAPMPVTWIGIDSTGKKYSSGIFVLLVFVILVTSLGQAFVFWTVRKAYLTTDATQFNQDKIIAGRLTSIVVVKIACWFFIWIVNIFTVINFHISGEIIAFVAIVLMPLSSALNPFLYLFSLVNETKQKAYEFHLRKWLQDHGVKRKTKIGVSTKQ